MFANALLQVGDVEIAGAAEPNDAVAQRFADEFGSPTFASATELYESGPLDAVIVATPDFAHEQPAVEAARRGIHLLVEKPLATTLEAAHAIADAARESGSMVVAAFENRWNPAFLEAKAAVAAGQIGEVISQSAFLSSTTRVPTQMLSWAEKTSPTWFFMSHTVDLAMMFAGRPVVSVYAKGSKKVLIAQGIDTYDGVQAILTFDDGTTAVLDSTWALPDNLPSPFPFRFEVRGTTGSVLIDQTNQSVAISGPAGYAWPRTYFPTADGRFHGFPAWMAHAFADNLMGKTEPEVSLDHALAVTEVQVAIEQSIAAGTEITLPLPRS
ncbi:Gfo/Idh/MocA family oxidoreductase [Nakamurella sp. YIM 132084]|uniref:Gfo/Idh/MocA family oxidoreductase n=2 Tax=Nakamurella leprariae TaxID=2803911 RepID=A0A938YE11_9ACTN|nr:Gfo/Idh/MocA family oxidoreductase [Nakamurella leprariae]